MQWIYMIYTFGVKHSYNSYFKSVRQMKHICIIQIWYEYIMSQDNIIPISKKSIRAQLTGTLNRTIACWRTFGENVTSYEMNTDVNLSLPSDFYKFRTTLYMYVCHMFLSYRNSKTKLMIPCFGLQCANVDIAAYIDHTDQMTLKPLLNYYTYKRQGPLVLKKIR